jgi:hypothetical protein
MPDSILWLRCQLCCVLFGWLENLLPDESFADKLLVNHHGHLKAQA